MSLNYQLIILAEGERSTFNGKGVSCSNISLKEMELRFQQEPQVHTSHDPYFISYQGSATKNEIFLLSKTILVLIGLLILKSITHGQFSLNGLKDSSGHEELINLLLIMINTHSL